MVKFEVKEPISQEQKKIYINRIINKAVKSVEREYDEGIEDEWYIEVNGIKAKFEGDAISVGEEGFTYVFYDTFVVFKWKDVYSFKIIQEKTIEPYFKLVDRERL